MHHHSHDSCKCCCDPAAMLSCIYKYAQNARVVVSARAYTYIHAHVLPPVPYYPGSGLFHYGKSRLHFLRLPTTGVSNLENRVEGGPSNHVFLAIVSCVDPRHPPASRAATLSSPRQRVLILGHNPLLERTRSLLFDGCRGDRDAASLSLSFPLVLSPSSRDLLFSLFFSFFLHHTDRPFTIRGRLFNRA